jgi:hypothetical protein
VASRFTYLHVPALNCVCCYTLFCEGETIFSLGMSFYRNDIKYSLCICLFFGRLTRYKNFKEGHKRILVATDLVGRGIDIERVNIVINYDMPDSADTYLHRVNLFRLQLLVIVYIFSCVLMFLQFLVLLMFVMVLCRLVGQDVLARRVLQLPLFRLPRIQMSLTW